MVLFFVNGIPNYTYKESEKGPPKTKHGPPTGSLILVSFCGVTVTANKLANLPICDDLKLWI